MCGGILRGLFRGGLHTPLKPSSCRTSAWFAWAAPTSFGSIRSLVTRLWNVDLAGSDTVSLDEILRLNACALCVDGGQVAGAVVVHSEDLSTEERDLFGKRSGL